MTDQQRADTINALGYDHMITPGLDSLVNNGVTFRQCFACGATCIASRAALFTGMYAHNTGVYSFNQWAHQRTWVHDLRDNGYHCVNIGKMHISPRDDSSAFHERVVVENPSSNFLRNGRVDDDWGRYLSMNGSKRPLRRHETDPDWRKKYQGIPWHLDEHLHSDCFIGNSALAWITRHQPKAPVFLQIGFTGPHEPYDPLPRHLAQYKDQPMPLPAIQKGELDGKPRQHRAHQRFCDHHDHDAQIAMPEASIEDIVEMRRHYYAKITTVDEKINQILDALKQKGYLDNALVIFTSDHGDMVGDHQMAYKWLMYESIVNVPLIIWDTRSKVTGDTSDLVSHIDLGPTVLQAAGIPVPANLEGHSLLEYANGRGEKVREAVFCEDNYLTMARTMDYKLVYYTFQEDEGELYDLKKDPNEFANLYDVPSYATEKQTLLNLLRDWILRSNYVTAGYKSHQPKRQRLLPTESPYLHPGYRRIPALLKDLE